MRAYEDTPTRRTKEIARRVVVNVSDSDFESDPESLDDDMFCPSWLKPKASSQITSRCNTDNVTKSELNEQQSILSNTIKTNKRHFELNPKLDMQVNQMFIPPRVRFNKKVDSPIHESFFGQADEPTHFQNGLIELLETEIEYFKNINLCQSVYRSLLENVEKYKNILTMEEQKLLFQDIGKLSEFSKTFIKSVTDSLIFSSGFTNNTSLDKFKKEDETFVNYNIRQLVINCNVNKIDIGLQLHKLFNLPNYRKHIIGYFAKQDFRTKVLNSKLSYGGPSVEKWLKEADFLIQYKSKSWSLETILIQPIQRIMKYPMFLKQLIDNPFLLSSDVQKHELNLALIKVNSLIDKVNKQRPLTSFEEIETEEEDARQEMNRPHDLYDRNLEKRVSIENEIRLDVAAKPDDTAKLKNWFPLKDFSFSPKHRAPSSNKGPYVSLVMTFREKYFQIKNLQTAFEQFCNQSMEFVQHQARYADLWKLFLQGAPMVQKDGCHYIDSIYSSYVDKMAIQASVTQLLVKDVDTKIVSAIKMVMSYCDDVKLQIQQHRKLRGAYISYIKECESNKHKPNIFQKKYTKAQTCINIENQLKDKLPRLLHYLLQFVNLLLVHFNKIYLDWLHQLIGDRSLNEYGQLSESLLQSKGAKLPHQDINKFYNDAMRLTKVALEEIHHEQDYIDHFIAL